MWSLHWVIYIGVDDPNSGEQHWSQKNQHVFRFDCEIAQFNRTTWGFNLCERRACKNHSSLRSWRRKTVPFLLNNRFHIIRISHCCTYIYIYVYGFKSWCAKLSLWRDASDFKTQAKQVILCTNGFKGISSSWRASRLQPATITLVLYILSPWTRSVPLAHITHPRMNFTS